MLNGCCEVRVTRADPIVVVPYDRRWPARFAAEAARLGDALGAVALRIDHVGSTSIPGIAAKDVVDIQVSVSDLGAFERFGDPLLAAGSVRGLVADDPAYPFFHKPAAWPHTFHVHVCAHAGPEERRHLAFCQYLRDNPPDAEAYEREKRGLARIHNAATMASRNAYADAKTPFIQSVVERAFAEGYPRL